MKKYKNLASPLEGVDFQKIRYANCWEDAEVLLKGLKLGPGSNILSIGSAGDNSFSLLTTHPSKVVVVDISAVQLYLIELKREAIRMLDRSTFLGFMGFLPIDASKRVEIFRRIRGGISPKGRVYWDAQVEIIRRGIAHQGKFERYFQLFAGKVLPLIHSRQKVTQLLEQKSEKAQENFYETHWNSWRWRNFFKAFFSKYLLGRLGRDKQFLKEVEVRVPDFILAQSHKHLSSTMAQNNYILNYALTSDFQGNYPHYLEKTAYSVIKEQLDKLILVHGYAEKALETYGPFDAFNLSNIFEYLDVSSFQRLSYSLYQGGNPHARYAYWNLMVDRIMSNHMDTLDREETDSKLKDRGFFYKQFIIEQKK